MTTTAPTHEQQAIEFAAAVREHLADLPEAELDELLDGLQADLAERLADDDELGDPVRYADELRQAAGLPARDETAARGREKRRATLRERWAAARERSIVFWAATPGRRAARDFMLSLKPVWWVLRGLVLAQVLLALVGQGLGRDLNPLSFPVLLALVVVSVQWGRGEWASKRWARATRAVAQAVAVVLVLPVSMLTIDAAARPNYVYVDEGMPPYGLFNSGMPVSNIFAFGCDGQQLDGVQLFDQNGQPITTLDGEAGTGAQPVWGFDDEHQSSVVYRRNALAGYSGMWNVFPLMEARDTISKSASEAEAKSAKWPMKETLPLSPVCATDSESQAQAEPRPDTEAGRPE